MLSSFEPITGNKVLQYERKLYSLKLGSTLNWQTDKCNEKKKKKAKKYCDCFLKVERYCIIFLSNKSPQRYVQTTLWHHDTFV